MPSLGRMIGAGTMLVGLPAAAVALDRAADPSVDIGLGESPSAVIDGSYPDCEDVGDFVFPIPLNPPTEDTDSEATLLMDIRNAFGNEDIMPQDFLCKARWTNTETGQAEVRVFAFGAGRLAVTGHLPAPSSD